MSQASHAAPIRTPASLALHLAIEEAKLSAVPHTTLQRVMDELGWTATESARAFASIAQKPDSLREYFETKEKRELEKWRSMAERQQRQREAILADSLREQQSLFIDLAKNAMLTPQEVMIGVYLLFGDEEALRFFRGVLLRARGKDRIVAHNFFVASLLPPVFLATHGDTLVDFPFPLFPPDARFSALNQKLLHEGIEIQGGAAQPDTFTLPSVFRSAPSGGGYFAPVQTAPDGSQFVDLSEIESAYLVMQHNMQQKHGSQRDNFDTETRGRYRGSRSRRGGTGPANEQGRGAQREGGQRGGRGNARGAGRGTGEANGVQQRGGPRGAGDANVPEPISSPKN